MANYLSLPKIRFPVYLLPIDNWKTTDGLLFLENKILDDKNMSGDSLGLRRLQTPHKEELFPLKKCIGTLPALLKQDTKYFIDYNGTPFIYDKTKFCDLRYYRIKEIVRKGTASLLKARGIVQPFAIPRPPLPNMQWVGILHLHGLPWMLYEYSETKKPDI